LKPSNHIFNLFYFNLFQISKFINFPTKSQSFQGFWNFEKKVMCKICHIKCDVMGFHPKAIAICLNLKMEAIQLSKLEKIHSQFSNKMYPLNAHNSFIIHVAK